MATITSGAVSLKQVGGATVVAMQSPELPSTVEQTLQELLYSGRLGEEPRIILDLSQLTFLGSLGVSFLLTLRRMIKDNQGQLAITGLSASCNGVLQATRVDRVLDIFPNVQAALAALQASDGADSIVLS